jgi:hypothetical protein
MREFSISSGGQTVAGATTLVFVNPATAVNPNLEFLRFWVGQSANATSAQQRIQLETQASAFPTLTAATPVKLKPSDPNASVITGGTAGAAGTSGINASAETRVMPASFAQGLGLFFPVAPATLTNWAFGLVFREI